MALEKGFPSLQIAGAFGRDSRCIPFSQVDLKGNGDCLGDFVLQFEEIRQLSVIVLGPSMPTGRGIDQLRRYPKPVPDSPHTAL
jgi:hypothetical protein